MTKEEVIKTLREEMPLLQAQYGVRSIALFGSYIKGTQNKDSDLDFLVDVAEPLVGNYFGLWNYLEKKFNKKIDLIRKGNHLREKFVQSIEKDIIYA